MGSIVGARIQFQFDENFEQNKKIYFTLCTVFDRSDGARMISFDLFDTPRGPALSIPDKFGMLKVESSGTFAVYPNNFTVIFVDGDMIWGEMQAQFVMPPGDPCYVSYVFSKLSNNRQMLCKNMFRQVQLLQPQPWSPFQGLL